MPELRGLDYSDLLELGKIGVDVEYFFPEHHERQMMLDYGSARFPKGKGFHKKPFKKHEDTEVSIFGAETEEEYWERVLSKEKLSEDVDVNDPDYLIFAFEHLADQEPLFTKHGTAHLSYLEDGIKEATEADMKELKISAPKFEPILPRRIRNGNYKHGFSHGERGRKPILRKHKRRTAHERHNLSNEIITK